jgi:hypothetical protein
MPGVGLLAWRGQRLSAVYRSPSPARAEWLSSEAPSLTVAEPRRRHTGLPCYARRGHPRHDCYSTAGFSGILPASCAIRSSGSFCSDSGRFTSCTTRRRTASTDNGCSRSSAITATTSVPARCIRFSIGWRNTDGFARRRPTDRKRLVYIASRREERKCCAASASRSASCQAKSAARERCVAPRTTVRHRHAHDD